jgi:Domain of unknown function (DUF4279)
MTSAEQKFSVTLYLRGDALDPAHVSTVLGMQPSRAQSKGERRTTQTNREFVTSTGLWALAAEPEARDLSQPLDELASKVGDLGSILTTISGVTDAYVDIFISTDADADGGGTCEFQLSERHLRTLSGIGIPIQFTVAVIKK